MDPGPVSSSSSSNQVGFSCQQSDLEANAKREVVLEYPLGVGGPYVALLGLTIAMSTIVVPLAAVLTEQPLDSESIVPTALEINGSKPSLPFSLPRLGESSSRDTSRE